MARERFISIYGRTMNIITKTVDIGGKTISIETGKLAKQAGGSVVMRQGDSTVLVTAVVSDRRAPFDFMPLTVDYGDRAGASGRIPGGFLKREGRAGERETLISRLIDRPIRPLFPKHFRQETQVIATALSFDADADTDILALCGASAALSISDAPLAEPCAGVRVVKVGDEFILNPNQAEREEASMHLVIAGTATAITMVEGGADQCSESDILDALDVAHPAIQSIVAVIAELKAEIGKDMVVVAPPAEIDADVLSWMLDAGKQPLIDAMAITGKHERKAAMKAARDGLIAGKIDGLDDDAAEAFTKNAKAAWSKLIKKHMRETVLATRVRMDGRAPDTVRDIWTEVGVSPRAHGSAVFTRGETQGYVSAALGTDPDSQIIDVPTGRRDRTFMLTYFFPPYSTGEARMLRGPKRREIGHGALARRALIPVLPAKDDFPYVMRCTSEILESNGSSSMATVCGSSLALMDAGVPLKAPVAGIAMGLIKEGDQFEVISDILGDEDALGDMDFKVAGTKDGITAFQMDVKIAGINREIMASALEQARVGRVHILDEMDKSISEPRAEMSPYAPRITTLHIKQDKIRDLIGPGGKTIRGIQEACDVRVTVDDSGQVQVASNNQERTDKAIAMIREITQEAELGALYVGVVKRVVDFGAFVEIFPGTDGLIHISHLANERVNKVTDVVDVGDEVLVRVIDIDRSGKIRLSRKEALDAGA